MLVTFRSKATGSITMFGDHAVSMLEWMGASGRIPGALAAQDVPDALQRLQAAVNAHQSAAATPAPPALNEDLADEEEQQEPPVGMAVRAAPLVNLLQRAAAARAEVLWEKTA